jgi:hypothetical protein
VRADSWTGDGVAVLRCHPVIGYVCCVHSIA